MDDNTSTLSGLYFLPPFYKIARSFLKYHRRILGTYVANLPSRRGFALPAATASSSLRFTALLLAAERFRLLALRCGTACHRRLRRRHL